LAFHGFFHPSIPSSAIDLGDLLGLPGGRSNTDPFWPHVASIYTGCLIGILIKVY